MRSLIFEYENHNGLELIVSSRPSIDFSQVNQFELNMMKQNDLESYLQCNIEVVDDEYKFHYSIHKYKKLQHYMQVNCNSQQDLYEFTVKLIDVMKKSYSYMLTPDGCIIHMDALFYDEAQQIMMIAYLPLQLKESVVYNLLQWFLHWSSQINVTDYQHLHQLFSLFSSYEFSLERIEQFILDYLYHQHTKQAESHQDVDLTLPSNALSDEGYRQATESKRISELDQLELETRIPEVNEFQAINNVDSTASSFSILEHPITDRKTKRMRMILIIFMVLCLPLAVWYNLYYKSPTTANLWLAVGSTIIAISIVFLVINKYINSNMTADDRVALEEETADQTPIFRYYEEEKHRISAKLNQATNENVMPLKKDPQSSIEATFQRSPSIKHKSLDTVQMGVQDNTVQLNKHNMNHVTLVRQYQSEEQQYSFESTILTVGRSIEGVHINDEYTGVSRLHVQFEVKNGLVIAKDLGSRNGSFFNNKPMTPYKSYILGEQDKVQLIGQDGPSYYIKLH